MIEFYKCTRCLENGVSARTTYSDVLGDNANAFLDVLT